MGREVRRSAPLGGARVAGGRPAKEQHMIKRVLAAAAVVAALGAVAAPASAAGQICLTTDVNVNGTPSPLNGTNCVDTP